MPIKKGTAPLRGRRVRSFWEPIFNPKLSEAFEIGSWEFEHDQGPRKKRFFANDFIEEDKKPKLTLIERVNFNECDFQGVFEASSQIVFKNCSFELCDLGLSTWINVKFTKCSFKKCSFTQSKFTDCELRDCLWDDISFSGNATDFENCVITNPGKFIAAGYTNLDKSVLAERGVDRDYQKMRNELTKATTARHLLTNAKQVGSDREYYEAVETFERQQVWSNMSKSLYDLTHPSRFLTFLGALFAVPYFFFELILLSTFGLLNGWGGRPLRPLIAILINWLGFSFAYIAYFELCTDENVEPFLKSFNIAGLAGYTTEFNYSDSYFLTSLHVSELVVSIVLYTVFFSTIVARMSRVR